MAIIVESATGVMALTFDDVLLQPGHSEVMPGQTDIRTRIAADIELNLPLLSAAMDTVTESRLAIAMAQAGGMGVIHRNLTPELQAEEVRQVKKFESGMVVNPVTIGPDAIHSLLGRVEKREFQLNIRNATCGCSPHTRAILQTHTCSSRAGSSLEHVYISLIHDRVRCPGIVHKFKLGIEICAWYSYCHIILRWVRKYQ